MNIYQKLLGIQVELKCEKTQYNSFGKYNYRNCEDILEALKPLLAKYKAALKVSDELVMIGERYYIRATARLIDTEMPTDDRLPYVVENTAYAREDATKAGMDGSQITGSSSSYARKYALNGLFAIDDSKDSDTTNNGEKHDKPASERKQDSPAPAATQQASEPLTYEQALKFSMKKGKYAGKPFEDVPRDYLTWCADNLTGSASEAARIVLNGKETSRQKTFLEEIQDDGDLPF